jgi:hypothetical protein
MWTYSCLKRLKISVFLCKIGYTDLYNNYVQKPISTFATQAKCCIVTWMHWLMVTSTSHDQIKMRVYVRKFVSDDIWNFATWHVVHNIPKSITKLTPADVSAQERRTLQSLPSPLNWKHKKITQAHRHEVNAGLFQFCTTTVHPTCSDDWTHVVWSMDGCDHAPMAMSWCCSVPNPLL